MLVRDNQQITNTSWFVGILEGEGNFRNTKKSNIEVRICNTDLDIIEACEQYLKQNNIYFVTDERERRGLKTLYCISVRTSHKDIFKYPKILYNLIENKMDCRRNEYQQVLGISEIARDPTFDLDWLIGIFEAEGSFYLGLDSRNYSNLSIVVANTNFKIIDKIAITLLNIKSPFYINNKRMESMYKPVKIIGINGFKRCKTFLEATKGKWIAKRNIKRTSLMLEYIYSRLSRKEKEEYSDRELQIIQSMKDLNF